MVGVPKSKGCSTCRTRSIKCDEARPSCSQCRRGGRKCPGYQIHSKFVDESAKFQTNACRKTSKAAVVNVPESSAKSGRKDTLAYRNSFLIERNAAAPDADRTNSEGSQNEPSGSIVDSHDMLKLTGFRAGLRSFEREGIVASFVQDLFPLGRLTVQHSFIGSWLWHVPEVLHRNHAMDLAAESLALAYFARKAGSKEILMRSRNTYTNALRSLSNALLDHRSRFASETLCATLLLVHFENFVAMGANSWISHAGGAGRLIQLRGPDRHCTGFDYAMFMASRAYLISQAVATGTRCFLDDHKWKSIQVRDDNSPLMPSNCAIYHEGLNHFANIPGLMEKFKRFSNGDRSIHRAFIHSEAKKVRSAMVEWLGKLESYSGLPIRMLLTLPLPPGSHTIFPSIYEYKDIITATFVVNYSAYLLQVNYMLDTLENSNHHLEESILLSKDICMSAAYCSRAGFCGIQAMEFALPLAISALPEHYVGWIQHQIDIFEQVRETFKLRSVILDDNGITRG